MSKAAKQERLLNELRLREGNNVCADCGASQPRWASWSLGVWLCVKCATIHRRMGTHISKVKSTSLDIWTKEQVEAMRDNGNIKSNLLFNPNPRQNPPPLDLESEHAESAMERFIFKKYRDRTFMEKPKKKSSRSERDLSPLPSPVVSSRQPAAPASVVATTRENGTSHDSRAHTPSITRTPAVSTSSPSASQMPVANGSLLPSSIQGPSAHLHAAAAVSTGRAMTAPLPDHSQRSFSPSVTSNQGYNPFLRQMTASAQIPSATGIPSQASNVGYTPGLAPYQPMHNPSYLQSNFSSSMNTSNMTKPAFTPQTQAVAPKGEVWDDLAGLSLNNNNGMGYQQPLSNSFTGYKPSNMPMLHQTNPFLQSSSMPYKSPSQISSMSSGSSFSSIGSMGSTSVSPQYSMQSGYQQPNMGAVQQQSMPFTGNNQMQFNANYQQQQTMFQQPPQQQQQQQPIYQQLHASNPYANQFNQVQQPYPQYLQSQTQFQSM